MPAEHAINGLSLRPGCVGNVEAAADAGMSAWISGIAPCFDHFAADELLRIKVAFRDFLRHQVTGGARQGELLTIACLRGTVVGFSHLETENCELTDLWLDPAWHGMGIGSALMQRAKADLRGAGCSSISLEVLKGNQHAFSFYQRQGFSVIGQREGLDPVLERVVCKIMMRADLE